MTTFTVVPSDVADLRAQHPLVRAWSTTKYFEGDVMNDGLLSEFEHSCKTNHLAALDELIVGYDDLLTRVVRENAQTLAI